MIELAGSIGVLMLIALIGVGIGFALGLYHARSWLSRNGCYTCEEGFRHKFGFDDTDE